MSDPIRCLVNVPTVFQQAYRKTKQQRDAALALLREWYVAHKQDAADNLYVRTQVALLATEKDEEERHAFMPDDPDPLLKYDPICTRCWNVKEHEIHD